MIKLRFTPASGIISWGWPLDFYRWGEFRPAIRRCPFPSKLIFKLVNNRPLHAVIAMDTENKVLIIVTVYEPDSQKFESDFITRKKT